MTSNYWALYLGQLYLKLISILMEILYIPTFDSQELTSSVVCEHDLNVSKILVISK